MVVELLLFDAPDGAPVRTEAEIALHTVAPGEAAPFWRTVARVPRRGYARWEVRIAEARSPRSWHGSRPEEGREPVAGQPWRTWRAAGASPRPEVSPEVLIDR